MARSDVSQQLLKEGALIPTVGFRYLSAERLRAIPMREIYNLGKQYSFAQGELEAQFRASQSAEIDAQKKGLNSKGIVIVGMVTTYVGYQCVTEFEHETYPVAHDVGAGLWAVGVGMILVGAWNAIKCSKQAEAARDEIKTLIGIREDVADNIVNIDRVKAAHLPEPGVEA